MESLSIKKTGKVMLAVALVIFMLVALLGLALYGTTAAASADTNVVTIAAAFTSNIPTAHSDSAALTSKKYYNEDDLALTVNTSTFEVAYTITNTAAYTGATLDLTNTGFSISGVKIGDTAITNSLTVSPVTYKVTASTYEKLMYYGNIPANSTIVVKVTYLLTAAINPYTHKDLTIGGRADLNMMSHEEVTSSAASIYVRSTASITNQDIGKTYDATAVNNVPTFNPAVSDSSDTSHRPAITVVYKPAAGEYSSTAPIDAGSYYVKSSTVANDYYEATLDEDAFTISPKAITITADDKTSVYSTSPVALTYTPSPIDFYDRDDVTVTYTGAGASISTATTVGDYTITPVASNANYTITPVSGTYTVTRHNIAIPTVTIYNNGATTETTITAGTTEEKTFNGKAYSFNYTVDPTDANSIAKYTSTGGAAITNVGTSTLTLTVNSNYYWGEEGVAVGSQDTANKTFTIQVNKANITVTLHHDAIEYLDSVPTTGYSITAAPYLYNEDVSTVSINQGDFSTEYTVGNGVGAYDIAIANTNGSKTAIEAYLSNYNVSYTGEDQLTVGKKTINVAANWIDWASGDSASMTYDKAAHGIVAVPANYTYAETVICDVAFSGGDSASGAKQTHVSGNEAAVTLTATFTLKGDSAEDDYNNVITDNYNLVTNTTSKDITITRKAVTITAADKSTTYGSAAPAFTSDAGSVLISGDTYTTEGSMTSAYTATAGNANRVVNTYDIVPAGWANNDYTISYTNGTLTVNKKVVTFTWSDTKTWVYDAGSHTITATVVGAEYGETITAAAYTGDASATNVGNYSRTVSSLSDNANYAITDNGTETEAYSITKKAITITITPADDLVYTSADKTVFTVTVSGMIGSETLTYTFDGTNINEADGTFTLSNASETFTGMLAQSYGLELTAVANGTGLVGNYDYTLPDAAENIIAKATFTPGAISYSGATVSWAAVTGTQGSDVITFTYTVNKGATEKQSSTSTMSYTASATGSDYVLAISFAGDRAANYNLIADQALLEVFSVTLADTSYDNATYGHPHNGEQIASVTQYAFDGETVPGVSDWAVAGYDFKGWYVDATDRTSAKFSASNAVTATITYVASWDVVTYNVTYKYKLSGASSWETYKTDVVTTYYTALETVPTITWFKNVGWNDAEAMNGATKTILDYTSDRTYYTVYTFAVGAGDVNGDKAITTADATLMSEKWVGGYTIGTRVLEDIDAAWAVADAGTVTDGNKTFTFVYAPATAPYYLEMVEDVNADGALSAADAAAAAVATVAENYLGVTTETVDTFQGIVIILPEALVSGNAISGISAAPASVKIGENAAEFSYSEGVLTVTGWTTGTVTITMSNGAKFKYTKA